MTLIDGGGENKEAFSIYSGWILAKKKKKKWRFLVLFYFKVFISNIYVIK